MADPIIDPQRFSVIGSAMEDCRRIVAAAKNQRWDVFKWAIALELTLATAFVAIRKADRVPPTAFVVSLAGFIVVAAVALILHYNRRAQGARVYASSLEGELKSVFDPKAIAKGVCVSPTSFWYDWPELLIFGALLLIAGAFVGMVPFVG